MRDRGLLPTRGELGRYRYESHLRGGEIVRAVDNGQSVINGVERSSTRVCETVNGLESKPDGSRELDLAPCIRFSVPLIRDPNRIFKGSKLTPCPFSNLHLGVILQFQEGLPIEMKDGGCRAGPVK